MKEHEELDEKMITAWVQLTGVLKNTRITSGMIYNEAIVMLIVYNRFRETGEPVPFKELVLRTKMLKSLVNRTIDSLVLKGLLTRCEGKDRRMTFVRPVEEKLGPFLDVHSRSLALAHSIVELVGEEDARTFIRVADKVTAADPLNDPD